MAVFREHVQEGLHVGDRAEAKVEKPHICAVNFEVWFHGLRIESEEQLEQFRRDVLEALNNLTGVPVNVDRPGLNGDVTVDVSETAGRLRAE